MKYYPMFFDMEGKTVLIAGGGAEALAKLRLVLKTVSRVRLVSDRFSSNIKNLAAENGLALIERDIAPKDLDGVNFAFAASGDAAADRQVTNLIRAIGIPVNTVDQPDYCDFLTPAIVDRDPVIVAIGTEGTSPLIARDIRAKLERELPARLGRLAVFASTWRIAVASTLPKSARLSFWREFLNGAPAHNILQANEVEARTESMSLLASHSRVTDPSKVQTEARGKPGHVWLVGAGPGDPELMTLKAHRLLQEADVIVHDHLVSPEILDSARRDARFIDVGKIPFAKSGKKSVAQEDINVILVREALAGNNVVRLKGGDPFVFGRGGEELTALQNASIETSVVPGISAAFACAASAGLPLTDRRVNRSLTLITGATKSGAAEHDWADLVHRNEPFAAYMAVGTAGHIETRLSQAGLHPATPVVIVENGTLANERIVATTIVNLSAAIDDKGIKGPALIYVGLDWEDCNLQRPARVETYSNSSQPSLFGAATDLSNILLQSRSIK